MTDKKFLHVMRAIININKFYSCVSFQKDIAYKKESYVNWDPIDQTVQVVDVEMILRKKKKLIMKIFLIDIDYVIETPMDNFITDAIMWKFKPDSRLCSCK